jgi:hypothetical protein
LYNNRLVIPETDLQTVLICEAHDQVSTAYLGWDKTYKLLRPCYYWRNMLRDVEQFVRNCHLCQQADILRDQTPEMLQPFLVSEHLWQHFAIDFKLIAVDKYSFNIVFVMIDRLSKQLIFTLCYKTATAKNMACMFINWVYCYYRLP